jgi:hypothetical protein
MWLWSNASPTLPSGRSISEHTLFRAVVRLHQRLDALPDLIRRQLQYLIIINRSVQRRLEIDAQRIIGQLSIKPSRKCAVLLQNLIVLLLCLLEQSIA